MSLDHLCFHRAHADCGPCPKKNRVAQAPGETEDLHLSLTIQKICCPFFSIFFDLDVQKKIRCPKNVLDVRKKSWIPAGCQNSERT